MKASRKAGCGSWLAGIIGAVCIWDGLVHLATHQDPIFGDRNHHEPGWVALDVLLGILLLTAAVSFSVKHFKEDDPDKDR